VINQRQREGDLSKNKKLTLAKIPGWVWQQKQDKKWDEQLSNLREIIVRTGQLPSRWNTQPEIKRAAKFVHKQRALYKKGKLTYLQMEELSKLAHWSWNTSMTHQRPVLKRKWVEQLANVREVIVRTGQLPSRSDIQPEIKRAARFVNKQRCLYKQGQLSNVQKIV